MTPLEVTHLLSAELCEAAVVEMIAAVTPDERTPVLAAFCCFLCVLTSYYTLLPLRDELGLVLGTSWLPSLFVLSLGVTAVAAPSASAYLCCPGASRLYRLQRLYLAVAAVLVLFYLVFQWLLASVAPNWNSNESSSSRTSVEKTLICSFYLWVGVQNIVCISSLWARCAEIFSREAAGRLFGLIGAGSTSVTLWDTYSGPKTRSVGASQPAFCLILVAAAAMTMTAVFLPWLTVATLPDLTPQKPTTQSVSHLLESFRLIRRSTYLLQICLYVVCSYAVASQFYFLKSLVAEASLKDSLLRTHWFATLNLYSGVVISVTQLTLTGRLLTQLPFTCVLCLTPVVCCVGLACVAAAPQPGIIGSTPSRVATLECPFLAMAEVSRKILTFALARPAREILFTVLSPEEKYKAKIIIDTIFQRLGDVLGAALFALSHTSLSLTSSYVALTALCLSAAWGIVSYSLSRSHVSVTTLM